MQHKNRSTQRATCIAAWCLAAAAGIAAGCQSNRDDCELNPELGCGPYGPGAGGSGGTGGGTGGDAGGGGTAPECIPSEADGIVSGDCGIFVSSSLGNDTNSGTMDAPFATISAALAAANGGAIYLCGEAFAEEVAMTAGVDIFGALDCNNGWAYAPTTKSQLNGPANAIALRITGSGTSVIADVAVTAADATDAGASSIAVLVDGAVVDFERVDMSAGAGADGALGSTPAGTGMDGTKGLDGKLGCFDTAIKVTDSPVPVDCGGGMSSVGGPGGTGNVAANGGNGGDGDATPIPSGSLTNFGSGQTQVASCMQGTDGADGDPGAAGAGATGNGAISVAGYSGIDGQAGQSNGTPGQGGGGGGGARGSIACDTMTFAGPSGGNGGTGGCGGQPGEGGGAGGSSIALVSLAATITLADCTLIAAAGGDGGASSPGQSGGVGLGGGLAASGDNNNSCTGGSGGDGGRGGAAGGGHGGHSIGIAFIGTEPTNDGTPTFGAFGAGGPGGDGGGTNQGLPGDPGLNRETLSFGS